jgi:hypothetical protein
MLRRLVVNTDTDDGIAADVRNREMSSRGRLSYLGPIGDLRFLIAVLPSAFQRLSQVSRCTFELLARASNQRISWTVIRQSPRPRPR